MCYINVIAQRTKEKTSLNVFSKDTIAAIATPTGRGGVGIVRVSGPLSQAIALQVTRLEPKPRYAHHTLFYGVEGEVIDEGVLLFFRGPHSFTGEDVLELQGHGGPIVLARLLQRVLEQGARLAKPGEFSEQAFLNHKLDLVQAEAIADLINAESEQAARCAIRSLQGEFSQHIHQLIDQLIRLRVYVEAAIDFPEEEIDFLSQSHVEQDLKSILYALQRVLAKAQQGVLIRDGITVVIAGSPNVGKSSLLNFLSGRDTAIVTDIAGTTRDLLREAIIIDGMPMQVIDTAGLRDTADVVEQEGVRRAKVAISQADLVLYLLEMSQKNKFDDVLPSLSEHVPTTIPRLIIVNKIDLIDAVAKVEYVYQDTLIYVSVKQRLGMDILIQHLKEKVGYQSSTEGNFIARRRHINTLTQALHSLERGMTQLKTYRAGELLAEELRLAQESLNSITGEFTSDDLLGEIFSSFCIGK